MADGHWVGGCCDAPFPEVTCSAWCAANGFGDCLYIQTQQTGICEVYGEGINQLGYCDIDVWEAFPDVSLEGISLRCVCSY